MAIDVLDPEAEAALKLPAVLDITAAAALKDNLLAVLHPGETLVLDAAAIQRITSPALQIFAAAAQDLKAGGGTLTFTNVPELFRDTANMLGLGGLLGLSEA